MIPGQSGNKLANRILEKLAAYYLRPEIEEVAMNREGQVWIKPKRQDWAPHDAPELSYEYIRKVCSVLANINQARFGEADLPVVSCELPGAPFRFQAIIGPNVRYDLSDRRGIALAIRALTADTRITFATYGLTPEANLPGANKFFDDFELSGDHIEKIKQIIANHQTLIVSGATATGKAQPLNSQVLTPSGWRTIGTLKSGDPVLTPDGKTARVIGVYPQGRRPIFKITFADGRTAECCADHLWKVWTWAKTPKAEQVPGRPKNAWAWQIRDLRSIKKTVDLRTRHSRRTAIPLVEPFALELPPADLPIAPYALGVIIGDGNIPTGKGSVKLSSIDEHILDAFREALPDYDLIRVVPDDVSNCDYRIVQKVRTNPSPLGAALRAMGLWGCRAHEKFVPEIYLRGSVSQRLELIRGLLDTDGTVGRVGDVSFTTTSERLARQVQDLVWSLGGVASIALKHTNDEYQGELLMGRRSYVVNISHPRVTELFSLPRKIARIPPRTKRIRLRIEAIEERPAEECVCIAIDHPDHLYVTDNWIVTHNTTFTNRLITLLDDRTRIITVEDARELTVPHANRVHLMVPRNRGTNAVDYNVIIDSLMRLTPDWVVCGELSVHNAAPLYSLMGKGHPVITTVHAGSPDEAIRAFTNNMATSGSRLDPVSTAENLQRQIGCIIQLDRIEGQRRVVEIAFPKKALLTESRAKSVA